MEIYYHSVDKDILILSADGGLNADNADWFVSELEKLVQAGIRKLIVEHIYANVDDAREAFRAEAAGS